MQKDTINFSVPTSWSELDDKQLRFVYRLLANDYTFEEVKHICFLRFSGTRVVCRYDDDKFLLRQGKQQFAVTPMQIAELDASLNWLAEMPQQPIRLSKIGKHYALPADFQGVEFEKYLMCENLYQGYLQTQRDQFLDEIGTVLYQCSKHQQFAQEDRIAIFYWFSSLKSFFAMRFSDFFQPTSSGSENLLGTSQNIGAQLQESMDAQIRALTKGDITKESEILSLDTWRALTELNAQAREFQELNSKYHAKL